MNELYITTTEVGLKLNMGKTNVICNVLIDVQDVTINNTTLESIKEYIYLGQLTHKSDSLPPNMNRRLKLTFRRNSYYSLECNHTCSKDI